MHDVSTAKPQTTSDAGNQVRQSEPNADIPNLEQPLSAGLLLHLQRTAGNTAVNDLLRHRTSDQPGGSRSGIAGRSSVQRMRGRDAGTSVIVQRHGEGEALPSEADLVSEVTTKETMEVGGGSASAPASGDGSASSESAGGGATPSTGTPAPAATRTAQQEATDHAAATAAGTAFRTQLTPAAMSLAAAQSVLTGAFGGVHTIVPGTILILADQAACSAMYDTVCIRDHVTHADGSAWQTGDCAREDAAAGTLTEGFAWEGIVYVNGQTDLVTATAHEMLHLNVAAGYRDTMGETFNEGSTEYLARKAIAAAGITVPAVTAYPIEITIAQALIALIGEATLISAYFGGAAAVTTVIDTRATGTWSQIRTAAEALQVDTVTRLLSART